MLLLDGKKVRDEIAEALRQKVEALSPRPRLVIVQVGGNKESSAYVRQKKKFGESIGVLVDHRTFMESATKDELIAKLKEFNINPSVHGIIVQLPLPVALLPTRIINAIDPRKDIDGLTAHNEKLFRNGKPRFIPATTRGISELLEYYRIPIAGKKIAVLGRSKLVGAPTALLFQEKGAMVTVCHSKTANIPSITRASDIVVVAIGKPKFIGTGYFRGDRTQTVVDVGITAVTKSGIEKLEEEIPKRTVVGDVDFENVKNMVAAISPVPGGVGPMTVAALFENLIETYERQSRT